MQTPTQRPVITIGTITKDGAQHLEKTLDGIDTALRSLASDFDCRIMLVDSASTDTSGEIMREFASHRRDTRVFALQGTVNASAARNVFLENTEPGYVVVIDGDIELDSEFVRAAINECESGNADVVYGKLPEIWYDENGKAYGGQDDRYGVTGREYIGWFKGAYIMSPSVFSHKLRYDESMERLEDIEFSLRVAEHFRILTLPIRMGVHHTDGYHSRERLREFIREGYQIPAGQFIRANLFRPNRIIRVRRAFIGYLVGLLMQGITLIGLILLSPVIIVVGVGLLVFDFFRFRKQGRTHEFLPLRFIGAWQVLIGFFKPRRAVGPYDVRELRFGDANV